MEMKSPGVDPNEYGVKQGYSEDYSTKETSLQQQQQQPEPVEEYAPANGTYENAGGGQTRNPFTQQQYQKAATNPFAR